MSWSLANLMSNKKMVSKLFSMPPLSKEQITSCLNYFYLIYCRLNPKKDITMTKLTAAKRKKIPKSKFGMPAEKKYPMPDKSHAANAKARATQMVKKGKLSAASKKKIDSKANKILKNK